MVRRVPTLLGSTTSVPRGLRGYCHVCGTDYETDGTETGVVYGVTAFSGRSFQGISCAAWNLGCPECKTQIVFDSDIPLGMLIPPQDAT